MSSLYCFWISNFTISLVIRKVTTKRKIIFLLFQKKIKNKNISIHYCFYSSFFCFFSYFSVGIVPDKKLKLLLLGISGSGKTEIAHYLSKTQRLDYDPTNGVHNYSFKLSNALCSLTEIGGSDDMQRIWHHYYVGVSSIWKHHFLA